MLNKTIAKIKHKTMEDLAYSFFSPIEKISYFHSKPE
jgi:hypothetical protein